MLSLALGLTLSGFFVTKVSREVLGRYREVAASLSRTCAREMSVRGELGWLQQEMAVSTAGLEKQGVVSLQVVSQTGLVLLHSDEAMVGENGGLTLNQKAALKGQSRCALLGSHPALLAVTVPVNTYNQIWGALSVTLRPAPEHLLPLRFALLSNAFWLVLSFFLFLLLLLFCFYGFYRSKEEMSRRFKEEDLRTSRQIEAVGAGLAHELKNALNGISLNVQLLRDNLETEGVGKGATRKLERVEREAKSAGEMLQAFLNFARQPEFAPREINLGALLKEIYAFFREAGLREGVAVNLKLQEDFSSVMADEGLLRHAVTNLLWNALQSGAKNIELACALEGAFLKISVSDDGPGVSKENREKIFEAFYTTREKGAGLGLAMAKKAARAHGGDLSLEDSLHGALFVFKIPRRKK